MEMVKLTCQTCHTTHELRKTSELPEHVMFMKCNWCPLCEDRAEDYYNEWWDEDDNTPDKINPIPDDPNQLVMPFIFDELNIPKHELHVHEKS